MDAIDPITHEDVAARARIIWQECGCPDGCALDHWLRAERELRKERQQAEEFRAGLSGALPDDSDASRPYDARQRMAHRR